jgi:hypothetical protein
MTLKNNHSCRPAGLSARTDRVVCWVGWHLGELIGVGLPLVLAVYVSGWFVVVSVVVLVGWVAHEVRTVRRPPQMVARTGRAVLPAAGPRDGEEVSGESA